jgi:hypothetical protein
MASNVLQDPLVGRRLAAGVVLGLETVDGHDDPETLQAGPFPRDGTHRAGHQAHFQLLVANLRKKDVQLPKPHQRLTPDQIEDYRSMALDEREDPLYQLVALAIGKGR